jgi:NAD(P)-dependent dehydrogenase (short-subunit alcohol dehydrogenase family)
LAVELAPVGILVNAVAPGFVDTPMSRATGVNELETEWFKNQFVKNGRIPLRRAAASEEIADGVLFLAARTNSYVTGHVLVMDGGLTLTL